MCGRHIPAHRWPSNWLPTSILQPSRMLEKCLMQTTCHLNRLIAVSISTASSSMVGGPLPSISALQTSHPWASSNITVIETVPSMLFHSSDFATDDVVQLLGSRATPSLLPRSWPRLGGKLDRAKNILGKEASYGGFLGRHLFIYRLAAHASQAFLNKPDL